MLDLCWNRKHHVPLDRRHPRRHRFDRRDEMGPGTMAHYRGWESQCEKNKESHEVRCIISLKIQSNPIHVVPNFRKLTRTRIQFEHTYTRRRLGLCKFEVEVAGECKNRFTDNGRGCEDHC